MIVTEVKRVDYVDCTPECPMQLVWINSLGGIDSWVFSKHQEYSLDVKDMDEFEPIINYLQMANSRQLVLGKEAYGVVKLGYEGLSRQQVIGIKEVLISQHVKWVDGNSERVVVVKSGTFKIFDTGESKFKLEFDIVLPKFYTSTI